MRPSSSPIVYNTESLGDSVMGKFSETDLEWAFDHLYWWLVQCQDYTSDYTVDCCHFFGVAWLGVA